MNIAFIVGKFPKISESYIINQITGLLDLGHEVEIFAQSRPAEDKIHPDVEKYKLMEHTHYFVLPGDIGHRARKAAFMIRESVHKKSYAILKSLNVLRYGRYASSLRLMNLLHMSSEKRFDIVHCHFGANGIMGVYLRELGGPVKCVTSFHGSDINSDPQKYGFNIYDDLFIKGDLFTANTKFTKQQMIKLGCDEKKIEILPMGLRLERFIFSERKINDKSPVIIVTVGRLAEKKGHEYAIKALAKVITGFPDIIYFIAGDGPLRATLESLVSELGIKGNVKFLGQADEGEVLRLYQKAHIFLLPSVTASNGDREGQALVLQEAQAMGMPVISTIHNGIPEGILNGKSGYLVPEKDIDALADRIIHLIKHQELWPEMGRAGRGFVEGRYNIKDLSERLISYYSKII